MNEVPTNARPREKLQSSDSTPQNDRNFYGEGVVLLGHMNLPKYIQ